MRQDDYEIIIACINHGAPALSTRLIKAFNNTVEAENTLTEQRRVAAENARRAELEAKNKPMSVDKMGDGRSSNKKPPKAEQLTLPLEK